MICVVGGIGYSSTKSLAPTSAVGDEQDQDEERDARARAARSGGDDREPGSVLSVLGASARVLLEKVMWNLDVIEPNSTVVTLSEMMDTTQKVEN
jgi:hypothetical protein